MHEEQLAILKEKGFDPEVESQRTYIKPIKAELRNSIVTIGGIITVGDHTFYFNEKDEAFIHDSIKDIVNPKADLLTSLQADNNLTVNSMIGNVIQILKVFGISYEDNKPFHNDLGLFEFPKLLTINTWDGRTINFNRIGFKPNGDCLLINSSDRTSLNIKELL